MPEYRLPLEIISEIISHLDATQNPNLAPYAPVSYGWLAPYATVSRGWQAYIERRTFATLVLNTPERLATFHQITSQDPRRQWCIREIDLRVPLEPYEDVEPPARVPHETPAEQARNNELFTQAIRSVLQNLGTWPQDHPGVKLSILAQSPSDPVRWIGRNTRTPARVRMKRSPNQRYWKSYLTVSEDSFKGKILRLIRPSSAAVIASQMPCLRDLKLELSDDERADQELRKGLRDEFANALHLLPSSVQTVDFLYLSEANENACNPPVRVVQSGPEDAFSARLRNFSQQLTTLSLDGMVVGSALFWPVNSNNNDNPSPENGNLILPYWPNLTSFHLRYRTTTPTATWYFEPDHTVPFTRLYQEEDCDPRPPGFKASLGLVGRFYCSAGRAAQRMPRLQHMELYCSFFWVHQFEYRVEGGVATASWTDYDPTGYSPDESVLRIWREAAVQHTGVEASLEVKLVSTSHANYFICG